MIRMTYSILGSKLGYPNFGKLTFPALPYAATRRHECTTLPCGDSICESLTLGCPVRIPIEASARL